MCLRVCVPMCVSVPVNVRLWAARVPVCSACFVHPPFVELVAVTCSPPHPLPPLPPAGIFDTDLDGQLVTTSPLIYFRNVPATGFYLTSTVFPDDPTRTVIASAMIMEEFYESILQDSVNVVLVCARLPRRACAS